MSLLNVRSLEFGILKRHSHKKETVVASTFNRPIRMHSFNTFPSEKFKRFAEQT